jgi:hypothetical protein
VATITDPVESVVTTARIPDSGGEAPPAFGAVVGTLVGFAADGRPLISSTAQADPSPQPALSCVHLNERQIGADVVFVVESGERRTPIILGVLVPSEPVVAGRKVATVTAAEVQIDGTVIVIDAEKSVTLRCGEASITLRRDGKIVVKGINIISSAQGANRIVGGSIELN